MKKPIECKTMRELFRTPKRWTKFVEYRTADGLMCSDESATSCCLVGGLSIIYGAEYNEKAFDLMEAIKKYSKRHKKLAKIRVKSIPQWNDHKRVEFKDVQEVVKLAHL